MLSRVLFVDDEITMHLNWLGLGPLEVVDGHGSRRRAHPAQKRVLHDVMNALNSFGINIHPNNPACRVALMHLARALWEHAPMSLHWRVLYNTDPKELAASAIADGVDLMKRLTDNA